jgi:hypothetical protein
MSELTGCELPVSHEPGHCYEVPVYSATWQLNGDSLTFSNLSNPSASDKIIEPWHKIDDCAVVRPRWCGVCGTWQAIVSRSPLTATSTPSSAPLRYRWRRSPRSWSPAGWSATT